MEERRLQKGNKENWINEQSKDIETLDRNENSFHLHKKIKEIARSYKRKRPVKPIEENNKLIMDKQEKQKPGKPIYPNVLLIIETQ